MTNAEAAILIFLALIAYFLYQIARQLTFLTGRRMRLPFANLMKRSYKPTPKPKPLPEEEKLPN